MVARVKDMKTGKSSLRKPKYGRTVLSPPFEPRKVSLEDIKRAVASLSAKTGEKARETVAVKTPRVVALRGMTRVAGRERAAHKSRSHSMSGKRQLVAE